MSKRTILISGASRGIGKSIAEKLLDDGHNLSIGVRDPKLLENTKLNPLICGEERLLINRYDTKDKNTIDSWIDATANRYKNIDTFISCAGIFYKTPLLFTQDQEEEIKELLEVNLMSTWLLVRAVWNQLVASKKGRIIVLVSMSGKRSKGKLAGYTVSKFALQGLCKTIKNEGWDQGIRITSICPGWVNTDMAKDVSLISKDEMTQPEDIASIASNLLRLPSNCIPSEICVNCVNEY